MFRYASLTALLVMLFMPAIVHACTCGSTRSTCDTEWNRGEVVFLGTVTARIPTETRVRIGDQEYISDRRNAFHFSVTERFQGAVEVGEEIVVHTGTGGGDCGYPFITGTTYLVYAYTHDNQLTTSICTQTGPEVRMSGVMRELRAVRERRSPALIFGTIGIGPRGGGYADLVESKPLSGVRVRVIGSAKVGYSTHTDQKGAYSFQSLPPDTYQMEVDLPAGLSTWERNMGKPFTVLVGQAESAAACRADLFARPDGRISGVVVNAAGRPIAGFVIIEPADPREAKAAGRRGGLPGYTTNDGSFSLWQIPPGQYQLLFYPKIDGKTSFADGASRSRVIDLGFGQHIENFSFKVPIQD